MISAFLCFIRYPCVRPQEHMLETAKICRGCIGKCTSTIRRAWRAELIVMRGVWLVVGARGMCVWHVVTWRNSCSAPLEIMNIGKTRISDPVTVQITYSR